MKQITLYIPEELFEKLKEKAKQEERSLNKYILLLLKKE
jgi:predicted HicB family RNase H-like nuclease